MSGISAVVITLNEEKNIRECLESLSFASEIILVDSGSTDKTIEIAREFQARVYLIDWPGYGAAKNYGIERASNDWVFSLDADERVSPELHDAITRLNLDKINSSGFKVARRTWYLTRWIKGGGWYPDKGIRLFNRTHGKFSDSIVHESVKLKGPVSELSGDLLHYSYQGLEDHVQRINKYSGLCADQWKDKGKKTTLLAMLFRPPWEFFRKLILRKGFQDGIDGVIIAGMHAFYVFLKYARLYEKNLNKSPD